MSRIFDRSRRGVWAVFLLVGPTMTSLSAARAQTPQDSASPQPVVPRPQMKPGSPVVEDLVAAPQRALEVHKRPDRVAARRAHIARHTRTSHRREPRLDLERPTLAGVELLVPIPRPGEPPHIEVPVPAYPLEAIASAYLTPVPPIVCHRVRREPNLPDPHLYRERTVVCEPDNP